MWCGISRDIWCTICVEKIKGSPKNIIAVFYCIINQSMYLNIVCSSLTARPSKGRECDAGSLKIKVDITGVQYVWRKTSGRRKISVVYNPTNQLIKTLPKAQRIRGLSSGYLSNFLWSNHKFLNKSWSNFIFRISTKHQLQNLNHTQLQNLDHD